MKSTPFSKWSEAGKADPHGNTYQGEMTCQNVSSDEIYLMLPYLAGQLGGIAILTAAKERLRWLSRKLYRLSSDHERINKRRATMSMCNDTDDELANRFFVYEDKESLKAGAERIKWLMDEIASLTK